MDIYEKFGYDPDDEFINEAWSQPHNRFDRGWHRFWWRNPNDIGMEVWLRQYDDWMIRVMAGKLKEEDFQRIRKLVENIEVS